MVINGKTLLKLSPIKRMSTRKMKQHGVSYGFGEAGYDIRLKQKVSFIFRHGIWLTSIDGNDPILGRFILASSMEEFSMPKNLVGVVHDKSTWARKGLSVFNTVIEPGWNGFLTLELVHHGNDDLHIKAGSGIAQVIFSRTIEDGDYGDGKYQNQANEPVESKS